MINKARKLLRGSLGPAFFALAFALFTSCGGQPARSRVVEPAPTAYVREFDNEILRIAENARETLDVFFRHLSAPGEGESDFFVKCAFRVDGDDISAEQIWIGDIALQDGLFYGVVSSAPIHLDEIAIGDSVQFDIGAITDWMFTRNGMIIGGHSIRSLLQRIPEEERSESQRRTLQMFE
ncbi:MAG: DUF2314 domain-containing protein [Treponema sp.]|nr:DUF2314 domain-containing protein [Treponema sp.]